MDSREIHHTVCNCGSPDHIVRFAYDSDMESDEVCWIEVQLRQWRSVWKRIYVAIRYILGYECRYGHWDCTTIDLTEAHKLHDFLGRAIASKESQSS